MRITNLTFLAFYLNSAIDTGKYSDLSYDRVAREIEKGSIFPFLRNHLKDNIDLSIFDASKEAELLAEWQDMLIAMSSRRKFGVENNGLCLLLAYCIESIQRRQDKNPSIQEAHTI